MITELGSFDQITNIDQSRSVLPTELTDPSAAMIDQEEGKPDEGL